MVVAKPFENSHVLDKIPDFYERLRGSYDPKFFEQEALGEYLNVQAGVVYQGFQRERNIRKVEIDGALPLFWALDFNVDPMSSIVAQKSGEEIRVLDEVVLSRASTLQACEEFHARYPNHQAGIVIYGDASGQRLQTAGTTDYQNHQGVLSTDGVPEFEVSRAGEQSERAGAGRSGEREVVFGRRRGAVVDPSTLHGAGRRTSKK